MTTRGRAVSISGDWVLMTSMGNDPTYYRWNKADDGEFMAGVSGKMPVIWFCG